MRYTCIFKSCFRALILSILFFGVKIVGEVIFISGLTVGPMADSPSLEKPTDQNDLEAHSFLEKTSFARPRNLPSVPDQWSLQLHFLERYTWNKWRPNQPFTGDARTDVRFINNQSRLCPTIDSTLTHWWMLNWKINNGQYNFARVQIGLGTVGVLKYHPSLPFAIIFIPPTTIMYTHPYMYK